MLHFLLAEVEETNVKVTVKMVQQTDVLTTPENVGNDTNTNTSQVR